MLCLASVGAQAQIVINEIMYNSVGTPDVEYVELYNAGPMAQDLTGWFLLDDNDLHTRCFLVGVLQPGEYLVVAGFLDQFLATYPTVTNLNPNAFDNATLGLGFGLGNGGDTVRVFNAALGLVDSVTYNDVPPWPTEPDGNGPSLELQHPGLDNQLPTSWKASAGNGTPGVQNSVFTTDQAPLIGNVLRSVDLPKATDAVFVTATVTDDVGLTNVQLFVDTGSGYIPQPMFDDGLHGDVLPGDTTFGALIPPQLSGTLVRYYVSATDTLPQVAVSPAEAPTVYLAYTTDYQAPQLVIHEMLSSNLTGIVDETGLPEDWVEIRNRGPQAVELGGMFLSDDKDRSREWPIPPTVIEPGGFVIFWCDNELDQGPRHTNFKLSKAGGQVALFDAVDNGNVLIDRMTWGPQTTDVSFGYLPDDADWPEYLFDPTPGASNASSTLFSPVVINEFQTTSLAGGTDDWVEFYNRSDTVVDMSGWHVSDNVTLPLRYTFPPGTMIQPGGFLSVDELQLGFSFSSLGERILLTALDGVTGMDYIKYEEMFPDTSFGRLADGSPNWHFFTPTSRELSNACAMKPPLAAATELVFTSAIEMTWEGVEGNLLYDTLVGDLTSMRSVGSLDGSVLACVENNGSDVHTRDSATPRSGQGWFYLVRAADQHCNFGTWESESTSQAGARDEEVLASPNACP